MSMRVITASAGSGKTHALVEMVTEALLDPTSRVTPEGLVAVTYTRRAAEELRSRLRTRLSTVGRTDLANRLRDARVGTLHAVCAGLIRQHALLLGTPTSFATLPELEAHRMAREVLEDVLSRTGVAVDALAERVGQEDWRGTVASVVTAARANGLGSDAIRQSGAASTASLGELFRAATPGHWHRLGSALDELLPLLEEQAPKSQAARTRLESTRRVRRRLSRLGWVSWSEQLALGKALGLKGLRAAYPDAFRVLEEHTHADELRADLASYILAMTATAAEVLDVFTERKRSARLLDFDDMLSLGASVLDEPRVSGSLREELQLVVVDEFQDVSPMQLLVVGKLIALSGEGAWVGDAKQAIYGFQGSDPALVRGELARLGTAPETLGRSFRSRPALVHFCSDLFVAALEPHGFPEAQVRLVPARTDEPELVDVDAVERWTWESSTRKTPEGRTERSGEPWAVANGVQAMLLEGRPVIPRGAAARPIRPRDIAVLCRSNVHVQRVAAALRAAALPVVVRSTGLLDTDESLVLQAAMRLVLDTNDGAAAAELAWLRGWIDEPEAWLADSIRVQTSWRVRDDAASVAGQRRPARPPPLDGIPGIARVRARRASLLALSPSGLVDELVEVLELREWCLERTDPSARLGNVDAFSSLAFDYESTCAARHDPPTLAGFVQALQRVGDLDTGGRQGSSGDAEAVTVTTYHASKGLEWPVVVCAQLHDPPRASVFGLHVETESPSSSDTPLAGRTLRLWPWPYGAHENAPLGTVAQALPEHARVSKAERHERARLLYVGLTRARDRLVLSVGHAKTGPCTRWLDELQGSDGRPALEALSDDTVRTGGSQHGWRTRPVDPWPRPPTPSKEETRLWYPSSGNRSAFEPAVVRPSEAPALSACVGEIVVLGPSHGLRDPGAPRAALGDAFHHFIASDDPETDVGERLRRATDHLAAQGCRESADLFVACADALWSALSSRWPEADWLREWPVLEVGAGRRTVGEVDLLGESDDGLIVVDHKMLLGGDARRDAAVQQYSGQLATYARILRRAFGRPVLGVWLHLPLRGELVEVTWTSGGA
ncbi:MAG: UvrD-helicase domain-containing protein [Alphaproteobacteria bacterium]|nr:UvrD-helicase domain-containing protein [Alphaproteobacteria bacterium]